MKKQFIIPAYIGMHNEPSFCPGDFEGVIQTTGMLTDSKRVWITFRSKEMKSVKTAIWISFGWNEIFTLIHAKLAYHYRQLYWWKEKC